MKNIINVLEKKGFKNVKRISAGGHGECFEAFKDDNSCIVKCYFNNSEIESLHEKKVLYDLHGNGEGKGNPCFFKGSREEIEPNVWVFISTTYEGNTLEEKLNKEVLSLSKKTQLMIKCCESLSELHKKNYRHFDIKPSNLYILTNESVVILDFGSAVKKGEKKFEDLLKTSAYCSTTSFTTLRLTLWREDLKSIQNGQILLNETEQKDFAERELLLTEKEDIYSLICCYYYMLTGKTIGEPHYDIRGLSDNEKITLALQDAGIPVYLQGILSELFVQLFAPKRYCDKEISFNSVEEFQSFCETVLKIEQNSGFHPEVLLRNSMAYFDRYFSKVEIDPELLTDVEEVK